MEPRAVKKMDAPTPVGAAGWGGEWQSFLRQIKRWSVEQQVHMQVHTSPSRSMQGRTREEKLAAAFMAVSDRSWRQRVATNACLLSAYCFCIYTLQKPIDR